ncbi:MAG: hypothetical protein WD673_03990 [Alphaproteobacteria bacterium]
MSLLEFNETAPARPARVAEEPIGRSAFARLVGVSPSAVTQAVGAGRLAGRALGPGKKLLLPWALEQWRSRRDPQADLAEPDAPAPAPAASPDPAMADPAMPEAPADEEAKAEAEVERYSGYRDERTLRARAERQLKEMEVARARDELRPRDEVERAMSACGARIAERLQALPAMADELAALEGTAEVRAFLKTWVRSFRAQLADDLDSLARGEADGSDEADGWGDA